MIRARLALFAVGASILLTACPTPSKLGCGPAPGGVVEALRPTITTPGELRYATARQGKGAWFFTVELHEPGDAKYKNGDLLTFSASSATGLNLVAVDEKARKHSTLPGATFHIDADGGVESRGCTAVVRDDDEKKSE